MSHNVRYISMAATRVPKFAQLNRFRLHSSQTLYFVEEFVEMDCTFVCITITILTETRIRHTDYGKHTVLTPYPQFRIVFYTILFVRE